MRKADIIFIMHHDSWLSRTIAKFMGSKWSHTAICYDASGEKDYILETTEYRVKLTDLDDYTFDPECEYEIWTCDDLEPIMIDEIVDECYKFNNNIYGYFQLISLGIRRLLMKIGIKIPNFIRHSIVCNQLVLYGYQKSNIKELIFDPESIDTQELYDIVSKRFRPVTRKLRGYAA